MLKSKNGSMVTETCIFVPVLIIAAVSLAYLIRINWMQIILINSFYDEIHVSSVSAEAVSKNDIADACAGSGFDKDNFRLVNTPWTYGDSNVIFEKYLLEYDADIDIPSGFIDEVYLKNSFVTRKWTGISMGGDVYSFGSMCEKNAGSKVWVFPKDGEKYHSENCRYVKVNAETVSYDSDIENRYHMCRVCFDKRPGYGDTVIVFSQGEAYHDGSCPAVKRQTVSLSIEDALSKGYSACNICGGV